MIVNLIILYLVYFLNYYLKINRIIDDFICLYLNIKKNYVCITLKINKICSKLKKTRKI